MCRLSTRCCYLGKISMWIHGAKRPLMTTVWGFSLVKRAGSASGIFWVLFGVPRRAYSKRPIDQSSLNYSNFGIDADQGIIEVPRRAWWTKRVEVVFCSRGSLVNEFDGLSAHLNKGHKSLSFGSGKASWGLLATAQWPWRETYWRRLEFESRALSNLKSILPENLSCRGLGVRDASGQHSVPWSSQSIGTRLVYLKAGEHRREQLIHGKK